MIKLYSKKQVEKTVARCRDWIQTVSERYPVPPAAICAVLRKELEEIDFLDPLADIAVASRLFPKQDSSTGPMQIFGKVGLRAVNEAVDRGLTSYRALGIPEGHRLDENSRSDVHLIWKKLWRDRRVNIEIAALNLLSAAEEMTGRVDFENYTPEELKHIFTRYNQQTGQITAYGRKVYGYYLQYRKMFPSEKTSEIRPEQRKGDTI